MKAIWNAIKEKFNRSWGYIFGERVVYKCEFHYYPQSLTPDQIKTMKEVFNKMDKLFDKMDELFKSIEWKNTLR